MYPHVHTHKGTLRDTGRHVQAWPAARHMHKARLCSELRPRFSASPSCCSPARSSPDPLLPAASLWLAPWCSGPPTIPSSAHWPWPRPQAPGWQLPQMPTQPNFTPRSGARPARLVAARLGHQHGGGRRKPGSCSGREKSSPSCRAGLPGKAASFLLSKSSTLCRPQAPHL